MLEMKHALIEFLLCGTIGIYCLIRCASLAPRVFAEVHAVVAGARERTRRVEEAFDASSD
jgi:hypothetical protein